MQTQLTHSTLTQTDLPTPLKQLIPEALQAVLREEIVVPRERLELSLLSKTDFESAASTNSAIRACGAQYREVPLVGQSAFMVNFHTLG